MDKKVVVPKQVIVVRKDLNMRRGKAAAQVAHASMKVLLDRMTSVMSGFHNETKVRTLALSVTDPINIWLDGAFTKVVVSVDTEEEFNTLLCVLAGQTEVPYALITDNGATEFHGVKTNTCVAVGPAAPEDVDALTGMFKLL